MRKLYLLRHCEPLFPDGKKRCLGSKTDLPLSAEGKENAMKLAAAFEGVRAEKVICSILSRSRETAVLLSAGRFPVEEIPGIQELNAGTWDGLTFDEIMHEFPKEHALRGEDPSLPPPGGESFPDATARINAALCGVMERTADDIIAVCHAGINRCFLCGVLGLDFKENRRLPQPYGCINLITYNDGAWLVESIGLTAEEFLKGRIK